MRWLSREWATGAFDDDQFEATHQAWLAHLRRLVDSARGMVKELAEQSEPRLRLDDGRIMEFEIDAGNRSITLGLVQGDVHSGYGYLRLTATDAQLLPGSSVDEAIEASEIWYWEIDWGDAADTWELRLLMWPEGEIGLSFAGIRWTWEPLASRSGPPPPTPAS